MFDDEKSMNAQLICNQRVVTYNKSWGMIPMGFSDPWYEYLEIIALHPFKKING